MLEVPDGYDGNDTCDLETDARPEVRCDQIEGSTGEKDGEVKSGEVVVKEQLAAHDPEGEIMHAPPSKEKTAEGIILDDLGCDETKMRANPSIYRMKLTVFEIPESTFRTQNQEPSNSDIAKHRDGTQIPDPRISY